MNVHENTSFQGAQVLKMEETTRRLNEKEKIFERLKKNLRALKEPKNVLLVGSLGVGKSSFINSTITALTGKYDYYADIGGGDKHITTTFHRISRDEYLDPEDEADKLLCFPTFIDIIGLDAQLSSSKEEEETVNSMLMNLIINGRLPENCDLLDVSRQLKAGKIIKDRNEEKKLTVDIIMVVISAKSTSIPQTLIDEIYREANIKKRKIPVFAVLTKVDECDMSEEELEVKKTEICEAIGITKDKLLVCRNYQPGDAPDIETDIRILNFMITLCNPRFKAVTMEKVEFEEPEPAPPTPTPVPPPPERNWFWKTLQWSFVAIVIAFFSYLIQQILSKDQRYTQHMMNQRKISRDDYWDPDDEADKCKHLELPTFIDIIGLDAQLSASKGDEETVNSILLHLIINGRLPENCDLLDASKKLKAGQKLKKRNEEKNLKVDTVIVVISTENPIIPQSLIDEIYREAKIRERNIPVFAVLTKVDISGMSEQELEDKKTEICGVIGITKDKLLVCRNYQPGDTPDIETDIKILEFMITVCNPRIQAFTYTKVEVEEDVKMKFWKEAIAVAFVAIIIALFLTKTVSSFVTILSYRSTYVHVLSFLHCTMAEGPKTHAQASVVEFDNMGKEDPLKERREELMHEIEEKLRRIKQPRNILILGQLGVGKSSFVNTVTSVLNRKFEYIAQTGSGSRHVSTTYRRFTPEIYWNQKVDKELSLPTFIDVSGLEEQLSKSRHVQKDDNDRNSGDVQTDKNKASANKQAIELIIQGRLPDNCDLFALFENLNMGRKIEKATEIKGMAVDIIIVVVSGETMAIPQALLDDIYEEANLNQKKIPVFGVMTKKDKIDESVNIEEKTKEICQALSIDEEHFLLCRCYQSEKAEDLENDIRILEFFSKLCNLHITAYEIPKMKFRDPADSSGGYSYMLLKVGIFVLVLAAFLPLILDRLAKKNTAGST
ncbi:uncharacterized protein LOC134268643 [Saccostrea cucullata]|uniref:uncharacterized protein LOC134268643 n=1 Tax=Saccostrea cuccullata TaxID=36930 RepID=UPI002ED1E0A6